MGRAKLKMELIEKEKSRNTTFKKRKEGLIRKLHEFTTLCDVNAGLIIYGPNTQNQPEIWPPHDPDQLRRLIDLYRSSNSAAVKTSGVLDFLRDRKKQIEDDLAKLRRKNLEAKYPTRPDLLNQMNEPRLRHLHAVLTGKADAVRSRIQFLRMSSQLAADHRINQMVIDHHRLHALNHNSLTMQFEAGSTSGNMQLKRHLFFESAAAGYYAPPPPPQRPYLLQAVVPPQLHYLPNQEDLIRNQTAWNHYQNNNQDEELAMVVNRFFSS